ncbi:MAG: hypothetical protein BMS9Abin12_1922 [Acidimicrobiia bacterium]|nr:MAG: hypothetical protein BMS9Abin12_1922 [Acidimicrobiia bacterium]
MIHARMLRESAIVFGYDLDLAAIAQPGIPIGIPGGGALLRFVDAVLERSEDRLDDMQRAIIDELGSESLVDAAAVFGNFEMMNRVAEGSGISIPQQAIERETEIVDALGLLDLIKG